MISLTVITLILILHFVADFLMQTDWMAQNKSKSNKALGSHILMYTSVLLLPAVVLGPVWAVWAVVNGLIHGVIDYVTSKWSSSLWKQERVHDFFAVIGLDQTLHAIILFATYTFIIVG